MKNFTTLIALATFATHAAAVSSVPQYDIHPLSPPFTLMLYAECNTDQCIANGSVEPVVTKTVGDEMVGTTMLDYLENEKGEGGKRKVAAITFDSTTDGVGKQFWVDDARAGGMHIAVSRRGMISSTRADT